MKAMLLRRLVDLEKSEQPLEPAELPEPELKAGEILVRVSACGVCHTELDEIEGRTPPPRLPVVLGHQIVGRVEKQGERAGRFRAGDRVGIGWIYSACGRCEYCLRGEENLCPEFRATGRDANGGYAEYTVVPEAFAHPIPEVFSDTQAAPLLCAGAIGYRSLRLAGWFGVNRQARQERQGEERVVHKGIETPNAGTGTSDSEPRALGLTGFGASGHLVLKMVRHRYPDTKVHVFARSEAERAFALELGAAWAGDTDDVPGVLLDAVIDTTPAWKPVVAALAVLKPGGRLVVNAIRKEETDKDALLRLDYPKHLWMEKELKSVANVTSKDISEFLALAAEVPIRPEVQEYGLEDANQALLDLKQRRIRGAKVLVVH